METATPEYVEMATRKFREELTARVAEYDRQGVEVRDVLGDPVAFAKRVVKAIEPVDQR